MTRDEVVPGMADAIDRRRLVLGFSKGNLAAAVGMSREGLRPVLAGYRREYNDSTIVGVARALRWQVDWYDRLKAGELPVEDGLPPAEVERRLDQLEDDVKAILSLLRDVSGTSEGGPQEGDGSP